MKQEYTWWATFGDHVEFSLTLSYWNPLDTFEFRRSIAIERFHCAEIPFVSVVIALWFVKMEWYLYIS